MILPAGWLAVLTGIVFASGALGRRGLTSRTRVSPRACRLAGNKGTDNNFAALISFPGRFVCARPVCRLSTCLLGQVRRRTISSARVNKTKTNRLEGANWRPLGQQSGKPAGRELGRLGIGRERCNWLTKANCPIGKLISSERRDWRPAGHLRSKVPPR